MLEFLGRTPRGDGSGNPLCCSGCLGDSGLLGCFGFVDGLVEGLQPAVDSPELLVELGDLALRGDLEGPEEGLDPALDRLADLLAAGLELLVEVLAEGFRLLDGRVLFQLLAKALDTLVGILAELVALLVESLLGLLYFVLDGPDR